MLLPREVVISSSIPLEDGETYRWRVSAVKVNPDHNLISASEDLMGVFTVQLQ